MGEPVKSNFNGAWFCRRRQTHWSLCNRFLDTVVGSGIQTNFSSIGNIPTGDSRFMPITIIPTLIWTKEIRRRSLVGNIDLRTYGIDPERIHGTGRVKLDWRRPRLQQ